MGRGQRTERRGHPSGQARMLQPRHSWRGGGSPGPVQLREESRAPQSAGVGKPLPSSDQFGRRRVRYTTAVWEQRSIRGHS